MRRRDFLKGVSAAALSVPVSGLPEISESDEKRYYIDGEWFRIGLNGADKKISILRKPGEAALSRGIIQSVELTGGKIIINDRITPNNILIGTFSDSAGTGDKLTVSGYVSNGLLSETTYYVYRNHESFSVEVVLKNTGSRNINIRSVEPFVAATMYSGQFRWDNTEKILTNGAMYYDAGQVHKPGTVFTEPSPYGPVKGSKFIPGHGIAEGNCITGWWNAAFLGGYDSESLVLGFAENKAGFGKIAFSNEPGSERSAVCSSILSEGYLLFPGKSVSASILVTVNRNPYLALEQYGRVLGLLNSSGGLSPINGWCSWFYTFEFVSEDEVLRNAAFISANLKGYGLDYVQIDEGYQKYHGEWEENERFPSGLKSLAETIRSHGLKPGIWVAPFVISEPTDVFRSHADWLIKDKDGTPARVGPWPDVSSDWARDEPVKRYGLDISHPGAQKWLFELFRHLSHDYGYEMFKIDFVAWSVLSAGKFHDPSFTPASAYRKGMEIIRDAVGKGKHINDCGPGFITAGLIDSMRIEIDQYYGFSDAAWKQYFTDSSSSAPAAAKRYYFHNNMWINDADHICINSLTPGQAMSVASLISLTGGNIISGDRLFDLDITKLEILKKTFPSYGKCARPVDLADSDRQSVFALTVEKPFGKWTVAGLFNNRISETITKEYNLSRFFLESGKRYLVFDFWKGILLDEITDTLKVNIPPGECVLLSIRLKPDHPVVVSTDRHILQGAVETEDVKWDAEKEMLSGENTGVPGTSYNLFVWFPGSVGWKQDSSSSYTDKGNYSLKPAGTNLIKVRVTFGSEQTVKWEIPFNGAASE